MATERVSVWRSAPDDRVLWMAGRTRSYAVEPRGELVFGVVEGAPMRSRRGREEQVVLPGQVVAWDASAPHRGTAVDHRSWSARLMVIEVADLEALVEGAEPAITAGMAIPAPVIVDDELRAGFLRLHAASRGPSTRLEREVRLAEWIGMLWRCQGLTDAPRRLLGPADERALRRAMGHLADHPDGTPSLHDLAAVAGVSTFRLIRLFRERTGLPPHALQLAHRLRRARRLIEQGHEISDVAVSTGFYDQSHLHRHFQRTLGLTPGAYRHLLRQSGSVVP